MHPTERRLALVEQLRSAGAEPVPTSELARGIAVSERTVRRDMAALVHSGVPVSAGPDGYTLLSGERELQVTLSVTETLAAAAALHRMSAATGAVSVRSALGRFIRLLSPPMGEAGGDGGVATGHHEVGGVVREAVTRRLVLAMAYEDRTGRHTHRPVEAHGLLVTPEGDYLIGWCRLRQDRRTFRIDRIRAACLTDEPTPERGFDPMMGLPGPRG